MRPINATIAGVGITIAATILLMTPLMTVLAVLAMASRAVAVWVAPTLAISLLSLPGIAGSALLAGRGAARLGTSRADRQCAECDYSLTGNTSGRCPECGRKA